MPKSTQQFAIITRRMPANQSTGHARRQ